MLHAVSVNAVSTARIVRFMVCRFGFYVSVALEVEDEYWTNQRHYGVSLERPRASHVGEHKGARYGQYPLAGGDFFNDSIH